MSVKLILIGASGSGKTTIAEMLNVFSEGRLKLVDTSTWWLNNATTIPVSVRANAKTLQSERRSKVPLVAKQARLRLESIYTQYGFTILKETLKVSDVYTGLRDVSVLEYALKNVPDIVVVYVQSKNKPATALEHEVIRFAKANGIYIDNTLTGLNHLAANVKGLIRKLETCEKLPPARPWLVTYYYRLRKYILEKSIGYG